MWLSERALGLCVRIGDQYPVPCGPWSIIGHNLQAVNQKWSPNSAGCVPKGKKKEKIEIKYLLKREKRKEESETKKKKKMNVIIPFAQFWSCTLFPELGLKIKNVLFFQECLLFFRNFPIVKAFHQAGFLLVLRGKLSESTEIWSTPSAVLGLIPARCLGVIECLYLEEAFMHAEIELRAAACICTPCCAGVSILRWCRVWQLFYMGFR